MVSLTPSHIVIASVTKIDAPSMNLQPAAMTLLLHPLITNLAPPVVEDFDPSKLISIQIIS